MEKITFKKFVYKYMPVLNSNKDTTEMIGDATYSSYVFYKPDHLEYINNKYSNYVWSVVKDKEKVLLLPGKYTEAEFFFITTVPCKNNTLYVNLTNKLSFSS
jgi:hypothetical protein